VPAAPRHAVLAAFPDGDGEILLPVIPAAVHGPQVRSMGAEAASRSERAVDRLTGSRTVDLRPLGLQESQAFRPPFRHGILARAIAPQADS